jgi:two-component system, sensor histidine kinase and response regulator
MGIGVWSMHYIGTAAMRLPAMCKYSLAIVALPMVLAFVISLVALLLTFQFHRETTSWGWRKIISALVMGVAIPVLHSTGMDRGPELASLLEQCVGKPVAAKIAGRVT